MASKDKSTALTEEERNRQKPVYKASYDKKLEDAYDAVLSREKFSYDPGSDALYNKYKDDYMQQGRMAMKDSAGQAAALTGGYGSSYSQTVAQQQYDSHLRQLGDVIPGLYELAYSKYLDEGNELEENYQRLRQLRDDEYRRYEDELEDYRYGQEQEYRREQDERASQQAQEQRALDDAATLARYGDFSGYAAIYGQETADRMKKFWIASNPDTAYNMGLIDAGRYYALTGNYAPGQQAAQSSGRRQTYYPNTAPDGRDAAVVQRELRNMGYNIAVDGAWGPRSQAAWDAAYGRGSGAAVYRPGSDPNQIMRV